MHTHSLYRAYRDLCAAPGFICNFNLRFGYIIDWSLDAALQKSLKYSWWKCEMTAAFHPLQNPP